MLIVVDLVHVSRNVNRVHVSRVGSRRCARRRSLTRWRGTAALAWDNCTAVCVLGWPTCNRGHAPLHIHDELMIYVYRGWHVRGDWLTYTYLTWTKRVGGCILSDRVILK